MSEKDILLHTCCAPCSISCLDKLEENGFKPVSYFFNPNIHPYKEYERRRDTLKDYSEMRGFDLILDDVYDLDMFLKGAVGTGDGRCRICYALRMDKAASKAQELGFNRFTTTLLVSPYQDHDAINEIASAAAKKHGVEFIYVDFRPGFRAGQNKARELGLYRQPYCGCVYSEFDRYGKRR